MHYRYSLSDQEAARVLKNLWIEKYAMRGVNINNGGAERAFISSLDSLYSCPRFSELVTAAEDTPRTEFSFRTGRHHQKIFLPNAERLAELLLIGFYRWQGRWIFIDNKQKSKHIWMCITDPDFIPPPTRLQLLRSGERWTDIEVITMKIAERKYVSLAQAISGARLSAGQKLAYLDGNPGNCSLDNIKVVSGGGRKKQCSVCHIETDDDNSVILKKTRFCLKCMERTARSLPKPAI